MFPYGKLNVDVVGKDASWIAQQAGFRVGPKTQVLIAPFAQAVPEEPFTHEKLSPVLGMNRVPSVATGIARSDERRGGKECVRTFRSRWSPVHDKKKTKKKT